MKSRLLIASALLSLVATAGCRSAGEAASRCSAKGLVPVTVRSSGGAHLFCVELADTVAEQAQGLMYRTDLQPGGGMLFAPYPPDGGEPREAGFWMKNTPSALDIVFVRADRTIARIAENTTPFSEEQVPSGEPVAAVLEIVGGRAAELGIAEGDRVEWTQPAPDGAVEGAARDG